ncbi:MAG TPA: sigma-70 family RNA polymerase sigma factor [Verrucomicrobia bacterium]|nr:sigma-70 family RNA polymerase sigma factor [Verrucomicrobiales bacterium]HIL55714.1 sigma-70 family RNA polymerase sigma factor [Verrucomicrobiota bacterium]
MNFSLSDSSNEKEQLYRNEESLETETSNKERDALLIERCQSGDYTAFDELITVYRGKIYAMIFNMTRNEADAWDLSQDVFIKAWKALSKFEGRSAFYTWLYRIAHNVTYDWIRKKKIGGAGEFNDEMLNEAEPGALTSPKASDSPDQNVQRAELRDKITIAINSLSEDHREVILLKEVEGLSYQEIAESIGSSIGTVMSRLYYARKKLQETLKDNNYD